MLQTLLAERFKLAIHRDQKVMPAFGLMLGKSGPKLQPSEAALLTDRRCVPGEGCRARDTWYAAIRQWQCSPTSYRSCRRGISTCR
jgi:uncharacterized protein (TIGR03435 family)